MASVACPVHEWEAEALTPGQLPLHAWLSSTDVLTVPMPHPLPPAALMLLLTSRQLFLVVILGMTHANKFNCSVQISLVNRVSLVDVPNSICGPFVFAILLGSVPGGLSGPEPGGRFQDCKFH